ncbi:MAG: hypothetical protein KDI13_07035 [Alphaproteobacteria bacterium]|nr:hypothetical protein [Alphaproteobacteria bacterium]
MSKTKFIMALAATLLCSSSIAHAESSYSLKKQGNVPFASQEEAATPAEVTTDAAQATETQDPSQIEPAAGAEEEAIEGEENSLEQQIRLPRKN